jgi:thiol-disulfide isomerase/thioredoxin
MTKGRVDMRKLRSFLLNIAFFVAVFLVLLAFQSRNMLAADGQPAPELKGITLAGNPYDLADVSDRPALVYFFAPWCKICAASSGNLNRLRRWRDPADIEIVAVALDWNLAQEVRDYVERHDLNVTVVLGGLDVRQQWQVQAYPSYYVLDREHRILRRDIGYSTQLGLWVRAWTVS